MPIWIVSVLAAWGAVVVILAVGLLVAHTFIRRAEQIQARACALSDQTQGIVVDIDELPEGQQETGVTVISNDVIDRTPHHLKKESISFDQGLSVPTTASSEMTHSDTSVINLLTEKITLKY